MISHSHFDALRLLCMFIGCRHFPVARINGIKIAHANNKFNHKRIPKWRIKFYRMAKYTEHDFAFSHILSSLSLSCVCVSFSPRQNILHHLTIIILVVKNVSENHLVIEKLNSCNSIKCQTNCSNAVDKGTNRKWKKKIHLMIIDWMIITPRENESCLEISLLFIKRWMKMEIAGSLFPSIIQLFTALIRIWNKNSQITILIPIPFIRSWPHTLLQLLHIFIASVHACECA